MTLELEREIVQALGADPFAALMQLPGEVYRATGGRQTLLYACSSQAPDAAIDFWGGFLDPATPDQLTTSTRPTPVRELAGAASCPIFLAGGAEDQNPSPEVLEDLGTRV